MQNGAALFYSAAEVEMLQNFHSELNRVENVSSVYMWKYIALYVIKNFL